jgi:hypothetical protein
MGIQIRIQLFEMNCTNLRFFANFVVQNKLIIGKKQQFCANDYKSSGLSGNRTHI